MQQTRKLELLVGSFVIASVIAILVMILKVADVKVLVQGNLSAESPVR